MTDKNAKKVIFTSNIRIRTWALLGGLVATLLLYFLINVGIVGKQFNSWQAWAEFIFDFILLATAQIVVLCIFYPDGELYGSKNKSYQDNKQAYNDKVSDISNNKKITSCREYCKIEYEQRKKEFIAKQCSKISLTVTELKYIENKYSQDDIKKLKELEIVENNIYRKYILSKYKKNILILLLFKDLPIEENNVETIMSGVECEVGKSIKDESKDFKRKNFINKFIQAFLVGGILAFITFKTSADNNWKENIVTVTFNLISLAITAVTTFSSGEKTIKVYKNQFYIDICNFIDSFNEWYEKQPHIEIQADFPINQTKEEITNILSKEDKSLEIDSIQEEIEIYVDNNESKNIDIPIEIEEYTKIEN